MTFYLAPLRQDLALYRAYKKNYTKNTICLIHGLNGKLNYVLIYLNIRVNTKVYKKGYTYNLRKCMYSIMIKINNLKLTKKKS